MTDWEIIQAICKKEDKHDYALDLAISKYKASIKISLVAYRQVDWQSADDYYQEASIAFWKRAKACKFEKDTKIFQFLKNVSIRRFYDTTRERRYSNISDSGLEALRLPLPSTPETVFISEEHEALIKDIVAQWDGVCSEYFELKQDLNATEIASKLGFESSSQAHNKWYKCKKDLFKVVISNRTYKSYVYDELLVDFEIKKLLAKYQDQLDRIWLFIKKKEEQLSKAEIESFTRLKSEDKEFQDVISFIKEQSGTRRLSPLPLNAITPTEEEIDYVIEPLLALYEQLIANERYEETEQEPWIIIDWETDRL